MTIRTITVPVKDLEASTALYSALLGSEPYATSPYYVGFRPEGTPEIGLDPHGDVAAGPVAFHHVDDIEATIAALTEKGASVERSPHDVGGPVIATLRDNDGNLFGLYQGPAE
jgi:catechol 2,3-dioxygenase-like lactoylglutathione lyase family enzyme